MNYTETFARDLSILLASCLLSMRESGLELPVEPQNSCKSIVLNVTLEMIFTPLTSLCHCYNDKLLLCSNKLLSVWYIIQGLASRLEVGACFFSLKLSVFGVILLEIKHKMRLVPSQAGAVCEVNSVSRISCWLQCYLRKILQQCSGTTSLHRWKFSLLHIET